MRARPEAFPCSLAVRSPKEAPGYLPAAPASGYSVVIRSRPRSRKVTRPPSGLAARLSGSQLTAPAPYPQGWRRLYVKTGDDTGSSRIPLRQCSPRSRHPAVLTRHGFVRAAPTHPGRLPGQAAPSFQTPATAGAFDAGFPPPFEQQAPHGARLRRKGSGLNRRNPRRRQSISR